MTDSAEPYVQAALAALRAALDTHLALSKIEAEARLIEAHIGAPPFEPHHLTTARRRLEQGGELEVAHVPTRGGTSPALWITTAVQRRTRRVEDAASRKRILMARYYKWVQGSSGEGGLTGPEGERAFQAAFQRSSVGSSLAEFTRGIPSVTRIQGQPVPIGPLDNAFVLSPRDNKTGAPVGPYGIQVLVEVKNIREWVYPSTQELYQVLNKTARLTVKHPQATFLPILVCRRAHPTTRFMAKQLGFFVIESKRHYFPNHSDITSTALNEIRTELALSDIVQGIENTRETEKRLVTLQQHFDLPLAISTWREYAEDPEFRTLIDWLDKEIPQSRRQGYLEELRTLAVDEHGANGGW